MNDQLMNEARHYVAVVNGPANGWGQHLCPKTGVQSHVLRYNMTKKWGGDECDAAIDLAFKEAKQ